MIAALVALLLAQSNTTVQGMGKPGTQRGGVLTIQGDPTGTPINISGTISSAGAADTVGASATFNANSVCATVAIAGQTGAGFFLGAGSPTATFTPSVSKDNSNWTVTSFVDVSGNTSATINNPVGFQDPGIVLRAGDRFARVCTTAWSSGSATGFLIATTAQPRPPAAGADVTDRAGRLLGKVYGSDGNQLATANTGRLQVDIVTGGGSNASVVTDGAAPAGSDTQVGGSVTTVAPTYTTGQVKPFSLTTAGALRTDASATTQPVSGTVTTTPPSNASTNVAQFGGTNVSTGTGAGGAGIPRVTISNDSSLAANQSVNVNQVAGTATAAGNGTTTAGTQRVTLSSDSTGQVAIAGTATVAGTVTANAGTGTFTNQQSNVTADYDTGAGTQTTTMFGVALPKSGGAVAGGTSTDPLRTDPTGTTTQPVAVPDLIGTTATFNNTGVCATLATQGRTGARFVLNAGTTTGAPFVSSSVSSDATITGNDCSGGTWNTTTFLDDANGSAPISNLAITSAAMSKYIQLPPARCVRVCTISWNSGSSTGYIVGSSQNSTYYAVGIQNLAGTTVSTASGNVDTGTQRVVLASDQPPVAANITKIASTATAAGNGTTTAGTQRVTLSSDSTGQVAIAGTATVAGTVTANQGTANATPWNDNLAQVAGSSVQTGNGAAAGSQRVAIANDNTALATKADQTAPTTATWTSATAADTAATLTVKNYGIAAVSFHNSGSITAGTVNFECSDDSRTTWYACQLSRTGAAATPDTTYVLTGANQLWQLNVGAMTDLRVRLNPQITGGGSALISLQASAAAAGGGGASAGGGGGTSSSFGSAFPASGTAIGAKDSSGTNMAALNLDASGFLKVNVAAGGGAGGTSSNFTAAFPGTGTAAGAQATSSTPSLTNGNMVSFYEDLSGNLFVNCKTGCAAAGDTAGSSNTLSATNAAASVALAGENGASLQLTTSTSPVFTLLAECSQDGGTTYGGTVAFVTQAGAVSNTLPNPGNGTWALLLPPGCSGATNVRVRANPYTSGSVLAQLRATVGAPPSVPYAGIVGASGWPNAALALMAQDSSTATTSRALTATANGLKVDGSAVTQPVSSTQLPSALDGSGFLKVHEQGTAAVSGTVTANAGSGTFATSNTALTDDAAANTFADERATTRLATTVALRLLNTGATVGQQLVTWPGDATSGAFVNVKNSTLAVTQSGTWTVQQGTPPWAENLQQINGTTALTGNGTTGAGSLRVTIASDNTAFSVNAVQSGTWTVQQGGAPWSVVGNIASGAADSGNPLKTGGVFNTTQPTVTTGQRVDQQMTARGAAVVATGVDTFNATVSGTVTTTPPANASTNVAQFGGTNVSTGTGAGGAGIPRVTVSNDSTVGLVAGSAIVGKIGIDQTTPGTTNGVQVNAALPAGTNVIGKVSIDQTTPGTTNAVQVTGSLPTGSNTIGALTANQSVNVAQVNGVTTQTGAGTAGTGTQRVAVATSDGNVLSTANTGRLQVDVVSGGGSNNSVGGNDTQAPQSSTQIGGMAPDGTLQPIKTLIDGTLAVAVQGGNVTLNISPKVQPQDPAGRVADFKSPGQPANGYETAQVVAVSPNPSPVCPYQAPISQTASAIVIPGRSGWRTHVCKIFLVSTAALSVSLTEGTGSTCGTAAAALAGSTTVANGMALAANGGWVEGSSSVISYTEKVPGDDVCLLQSAATNLAGSITYTYGPQ